MPEETRIVIKGGRTEDTVISSFPGAAQAAPWGGLVPLQFFLYAPVEKSRSGPTGHFLFCDVKNDIRFKRRDDPDPGQRDTFYSADQPPIVTIRTHTVGAVSSDAASTDNLE